MKKTVMIGIDGATLDLMKKWMENGKLPNFQKIRKNGTWGKLKSTTPPFSAPAWTSIVTGCNPGKHGIYGFESTDTLEPHLISSRYRKIPAIWNYLTDIGVKNIIVNIPGTYPPEKINGVMITGLLTPSKESNFTYPKKIKERLTGNDLGEYELEQLWLEDFSRSRTKKRAPEKLLNHINKQMTSRLRVGLNLMKETDWDFTMIVFRGTDTAQHFLFEDKDLLLLCYQKVDELVGKIMDSFPNAVFFIVSDHGFEEIKKILYPDNVLYNAKYLTPSQDPYSSLVSQFYLLIHRVVNYFLKLLPQKFLKESKGIRKLLFSGSSKAKLIDFSKTIAFSTAEGRCIRICRKNKYKNGIVEEKDYEKTCNEISKLLKDLKDPNDGSQIIEKVYRWNEVYGKNAIDPPDLIFDLKKGITAAEWIRFPKSLYDIMQSKKRDIPYIFNQDPAGRSGDHSQYGVFFAYGEGIKTNYGVSNMSVEDVLPMIFTAMGIPTPNSVDGRVHEDIFIKKPTVKKIDWTLSSSKQTLVKDELEKIRGLRKFF